MFSVFQIFSYGYADLFFLPKEAMPNATIANHR